LHAENWRVAQWTKHFIGTENGVQELFGNAACRLVLTSLGCCAANPLATFLMTTGVRYF
jgi:hypothetical protein